ncbi:MAG: methylated-DNA--[protein]-cysteine S-methyltransferase [Bacteroidetes bacterium]|nr:methylated-DNA--[protein]-cysteine S-methyltransferase [Bacteroidota bacterium]
MNEYLTAYYQSPVGMVEISGNQKGIRSLYFVDVVKKNEPVPDALRICMHQIDEYFTRKRKIFELPLNLTGTPFQLKVWKELQKIPFGKTVSYMDLAKQLGDIKSIRAVGSANGKNPVSIIIPCHRVIGSDGSLTGYGGGLWRKKWLLEFEQGMTSLI